MEILLVLYVLARPCPIGAVEAETPSGLPKVAEEEALAQPQAKAVAEEVQGWLMGVQEFGSDEHSPCGPVDMAAVMLVLLLLLVLRLAPGLALVRAPTQLVHQTPDSADEAGD